VYELRDASWFDRGTGQCKGVYDDTQDLALIIVEAEDMSEGKDGEGGGAAEGEGGFLKEELLLSTKVEKEDIYARQQGTLYLLLLNGIKLTSRYTDSMDGTSE
jgi:protein phosphatase-4 regulatory subunit 3